MTFKLISTLLSEEEKAQLCHVLQLNTDVFSWTHAGMNGISPTHASHRLNVALFAKLVRQKVRRFHPDRHLVIHRDGKIGPAQWASPVHLELGPGWAIKLLAGKKSGQIWPSSIWPGPVWPDLPEFFFTFKRLFGPTSPVFRAG